MRTRGVTALERSVATNQPTTSPATNQPTTSPATNQPTTSPATNQPTTSPATNQPTTSPATNQPTTSPATNQPYAVEMSSNTSLTVPAIDVSSNSPPAVRDQETTENSSFHLHLDVSLDCDIQSVIRQISVEQAEHQLLTVRRDHILDDVVTFYKSHVDINKGLLVTFEGEVGLDQGGLTREMFSCFWQEASQQYFKGNRAKVLWISKHRRSQARNIFPVLGKVFEHQVRVLGTVPVELSRSSLMVMAFADQDVESDFLISDLISFLPEADSVLLERCLDASSWSADEGRRILRLFTIYGMSVLPTPNNLREHLLNLAITELLDNSSAFNAMFRAGLTAEFKEMFMSSLNTENIHYLKSQQEASPEKVAQMIDDFYDRSDLTIFEQIVVSHLSNLIRELNRAQLQRFLRWVTGSSAMPSSLTVMFNATSGLARAPVAHTCGNMLELSTQYESYEEFRREMLLVIDSDDSFSFSLS